MFKTLAYTFHEFLVTDRYFGFRQFRLGRLMYVKSVKIRLYPYILYICVNRGRIFGRDDAGSKPETNIRVLRYILQQVPARSTSRIHIRPVQTLSVFGIYQMRQIEELILITHVFQCHYIACIQRDSTAPDKRGS
jgi:hypothetical protein